MGKSGCTLSEFERRLFCAKRKVSAECLRPWFLKYRCPYLEWSKEDVRRAAQKVVKEIRTRSAFTSEAVEYAERFRPNLRLVSRDQIVKPRRHVLVPAAS
jgi:hypothetical protein